MGHREHFVRGRYDEPLYKQGIDKKVVLFAGYLEKKNRMLLQPEYIHWFFEQHL